MRIPNPVNLAMVRHVAERLGELRDSVVFVGGAVMDLLITDPAAPPARPTKDVDVIVEVVSLREYHKLGGRLRSLGFQEDSQTEGAPLCRWVIDGIKVDTMPVRGQVLGFSSEYYSAAVETAASREIAEGITIRLISAPCFLATKLEAFKDRGHDDFMGSPDMEDVIAVLDGRPEVIDEIRDSPLPVRDFLVRAFAALLKDDRFLDSLSGHLESVGENPERVSIFLERVRAIASLDVGQECA
jgi:predicted nucleotidyltransferase